MKKILQFLSATVVTMAVGFAPAVSAATCSISTTGPNSNNTCTVSGNNVVTVTCVNGVTVTNLNNQTALTGAANVSGNTVSGTATSGDASNLNAAATQLAQNCATAAPAATTTAPTTTTTPTTPLAAGQGAGAAPAPAASGSAAKKVAALPNTGPNTLVTGLAVSAATVGTVAGFAYAAIASYRRRAFKV